MAAHSSLRGSISSYALSGAIRTNRLSGTAHAGAAGSVAVDEELSETSNNPISNKAVSAALKGKQDVGATPVLSASEILRILNS